MFNIRFVPFVGGLDIQTPSCWAVEPDSPVSIYYTEPKDLSRHEILKRFNKVLIDRQITYIRPLKNLTGEWLIDLKELRNTFDGLAISPYLDGKITVEPDYYQNKRYDEFEEEVMSEESSVRFVVYPEDVITSTIQFITPVSEEIQAGIKRFQQDYPNNRKCAFLMMKFEDSPIQEQLIQILKKVFEENGIHLLRADERWYSDDLLGNIKTYMHCCAFGVALFERINSEYFNPNVSLEIGYMMAMNKSVLLLKDSTLKSLQTDLVGRLYHEFDYQNAEQSLTKAVNKWLSDKSL